MLVSRDVREISWKTLSLLRNYLCPALAADELKELGYPDQTVEDGKVTFRVIGAICRTNLC